MKSDPGTTTPKRHPSSIKDIVDTALLIVLFLACAWVVVELATGGPTGLLCAASRFACVVVHQ